MRDQGLLLRASCLQNWLDGKMVMAGWIFGQQFLNKAQRAFLRLEINKVYCEKKNCNWNLYKQMNVSKMFYNYF